MTRDEPSAPKRPGHSFGGWAIFAIILLGAAALVIFFGWLPRHRNSQKIEQEARERVQEKPRVDAYRVKRAPSVSELMVPGTALAYTEAYIYARASGYVTRRFVDIGDHVEKGQVLATIDAPDLDRQVAQARAALRESESSLAQMQAQLHLNALNWDRYKVLVAKGVLSRQQGDQQEANYRVAEANVGAAENTIQGNRENLDRLVVLQGYERVTAPFSGVITARNVDVGALISAQGNGLGTNSSSTSPGFTLAAAQANNSGASGSVSSSVSPVTGGAQGGEMFGMADIGRLRVLVSVPEAYTSAVRVGQHAQLLFQELASEKYDGTVTRTSSAIDQNTRTLLVEVQVQNRNGRLLPGMYVVVNFVSTQGERPLLIPGEAIVVRNAKQTVAVIDQNVVHFRPVVLGRDYGDETEVLGGLNDGEVIVRTLNDEVEEGVQVIPQFTAAKGQQTGGQSDRNASGSGQYGAQGLDNKAQKTGQQKKK
ncbi:MAG TPA: efflux RND transporter periplasmic adaptor subunit [Bryobacteraceae bacterium]|jgi:multidrug efflux pump subunit AcrA (membrane-fusion protein)|nr:efflux RND transporter periplasmic adaptor subunit [Bryobacteraceae bacterium]